MEPPVSAVPKVIMTLPRESLSPSEAGCFSPQATSAKTIARARIRDNTFFMRISSFQKIYILGSHRIQRNLFSVPTRDGEDACPFCDIYRANIRYTLYLHDILIFYGRIIIHGLRAVKSFVGGFSLFSMKFYGPRHSIQKTMRFFVLLNASTRCFLNEIRFSIQFFKFPDGVCRPRKDFPRRLVGGDPAARHALRACGQAGMTLRMVKMFSPSR